MADTVSSAIRKRLPWPMPAVLRVQPAELKTEVRPLEKPLPAESRCTLKRPLTRPSHKSLQRKEKLCKKISNLENELIKARRDLESHLQNSADRSFHRQVPTVSATRRNHDSSASIPPAPERSRGDLARSLRWSLGHAPGPVGPETTMGESVNSSSLSVRQPLSEAAPVTARETAPGSPPLDISHFCGSPRRGGSSRHLRDMQESRWQATSRNGSPHDHENERRVAVKLDWSVASESMPGFAITESGSSTGDGLPTTKRAAREVKNAPFATFNTASDENIPPVPQIPPGIAGKRAALHARPGSRKMQRLGEPGAAEDHWIGWDDDVF